VTSTRLPKDANREQSASRSDGSRAALDPQRKATLIFGPKLAAALEALFRLEEANVTAKPTASSKVKGHPVSHAECSRDSCPSNTSSRFPALNDRLSKR